MQNRGYWSLRTGCRPWNAAGHGRRCIDPEDIGRISTERDTNEQPPGEFRLVPKQDGSNLRRFESPGSIWRTHRCSGTERNRLEGRDRRTFLQIGACKRCRHHDEWDETQIQEIKKRRKDLWWNGALIGMGAGGLAGALLGVSSCGHLDDECQAYAVPAGLFGGMAIGVTAGALIDFSIKKMETAFRLPNNSLRRTIGFTPILTRDRQGLSLSVTF
jgi:hypothetical protein